ncbi:syndecan isoform X3 [Drosophila persimilis]|uniref:syndecan isoform X3 n=1 Tax=Drosophila persimilis TaxID=7234 RepID=UPI000F08A2DF|nr:syndecan isoform X3 [Drosophila persimilis]
MMPRQRTSTLTATYSLRCNGKCLMLSALLMSLLVAATHAVDQKSIKASAAEPSTLSGGAASPAASGPRDAIYIDDDSIEGSGGRGGIHDDLEKDPDYSGSGFGPDDEDAEPDHHSQHGSHNTRISQSGGSSINSKHKSNDNSHNDDLDHISSRFNNNNNNQNQNQNQNQIDNNSQNLNNNNNNNNINNNNNNPNLNNNHHPANSGTIIGSSTTANHNSNQNHIGGQSGGIISGSGGEIGGHSGTGINTIAGGGSNVHELDPNTNVNSQPSDTKPVDHRPNGNEVVIMSEDDRTSSFFSQPGILAAVIGGAVVGLLCAILVVMFIVYRMRKKDEGSYALDEPKRSPANNSYAKNANNREFYA